MGGVICQKEEINMEAYSAFAEIYDEFMDDIPYEKWCEFITDLLKKGKITDGIVCELGCGTGVMTRLLAEQGFDMIGIDLSYEMLQKAREHENDKEILYLNQDMREFELFGTVSAIVSVCDSMNYILSSGDLVRVFKNANNYLEKDGLFIFDMKTEHFYKNVLGDGVQVENAEDATLIWENYFDEENKIHAYELTMFFPVSAGESGSGNLYEKFTEYHEQRAYSIDEVKEAIHTGGMELVGIYDEKTHQAPNDNSERVFFVVKETFQPGKYYGE